MPPTQNGRLVLAGSASELERDLPFSVFVDALDEYLRGLSPDRLAALDEDVRTELSQVFPSLSALGTASGVALQHERYRSHRAVRALLEELAKTRPLVLVLDDVHWADSASVELLGALLRRPPSRGRPHRRWPSAHARWQSASLPQSNGPIARGRWSGSSSAR